MIDNTPPKWYNYVNLKHPKHARRAKMKNAGIEAINKLTIPEEDVFGSVPNILWINAACHENKFTLNLKPHNHAFFEIHIVISGSIAYRFNDTDVTVSAGQLMFIPPRVIHCIPYQSEDFEKMTVAFEAEGALKAILFGKRERAIDMSEDSKASLDFILRRAQNKTLCSELMIKNRLLEIIYSVAEASVPKTHSPSSTYDTRIIKAKKYIEDNPHIFLSCDEVARYCNLSAKQLGRLFQKYENCSLLIFIHGQKIEAAKKMIRETDELFESISEKLGFSSVNYFGKFFTRCTGMTPGDYRRSYSLK